MATLSSAIAEVDLMNPNSLTAIQKTVYINRLEGRVLSEIIELFENINIPLVYGTLKYEIQGLSSDIDIIKVRTESRELIKEDSRSDSQYGYTITLEGGKYYITLKDTYNNKSLIITVQKRDPKLDYSTDSSKQLLVPVPYDDVYVLYLNSMIYHQSKDYNEYNNNVILFNDRFEAFEIWYNKRKPKVNIPARNVWW